MKQQHIHYFAFISELNEWMNEQECIPVGCVPPAAVTVRGGLPQCMLGCTPGCGPGDPPQVWAWRPSWLWAPQVWACRPSQVWAWRSPQASPLNFSLGCGPGDPPQPDPSTSPLGVGLETCKACWDISPKTCCKACWDTTCNACWDTTHPVNRITDTCKNITLPQLRCGW